MNSMPWSDLIFDMCSICRSHICLYKRGYAFVYAVLVPEMGLRIALVDLAVDW